MAEFSMVWACATGRNEHCGDGGGDGKLLHEQSYSSSVLEFGCWHRAGRVRQQGSNDPARCGDPRPPNDTPLSYAQVGEMSRAVLERPARNAVLDVALQPCRHHLGRCRRNRDRIRAEARRPCGFHQSRASPSRRSTPADPSIKLRPSYGGGCLRHGRSGDCHRKGPSRHWRIRTQCSPHPRQQSPG